jgi:NADH:ubiquinone oxidoreductase subunit D
MAIQAPTRLPMEIESQEEGDLGSKAHGRELRPSASGDPRHAAHESWRSKARFVTNMELEIGYLHTGFEKLGEFRTYNQTVTITDRMNYLSPLCNNVGLSCAIEKMMGIEVTPRCAAIRVILYELSRVADHILCVGLQAMDLGAFSIMLWSFIERERLYDIFEDVTARRLTTSYTRVGACSATCPTTSPTR